MRHSYEYKAVIKEIEGIAESRRIIEECLKGIFTNKTLPLWERWNLYVKAVESGIYRSESHWVLGFDVLNDLNMEWYDDLHVDRYQTVCFVDVYENLYESLAWSVDQGEITQEKVHEYLPRFQEEVLATGHSHMTCDW